MFPLFFENQNVIVNHSKFTKSGINHLPSRSTAESLYVPRRSRGSASSTASMMAPPPAASLAARRTSARLLSVNVREALKNLRER